MRGLARFTAVIFLLLGIVLLVVGGGLAFRGLLDSNRAAPAIPGLAPGLSALMAFGGVIAGVAVAFQGLVLGAAGELLWLMAGVSYNAQLSSEYMEELVRRMGNVSR